ALADGVKSSRRFAPLMVRTSSEGPSRRLADGSIRDRAAVSPAVARLLLSDKRSHAGVTGKYSREHRCRSRAAGVASLANRQSRDSRHRPETACESCPIRPFDRRPTARDAPARPARERRSAFASTSVARPFGGRLTARRSAEAFNARDGTLEVARPGERVAGRVRAGDVAGRRGGGRPAVDGWA